MHSENFEYKFPAGKSVLLLAQSHSDTKIKACGKNMSAFVFYDIVFRNYTVAIVLNEVYL